MRAGLLLKTLLFATALALLPAASLAQSAPLQVGVSELPPFAFQSDGQWDGVAVTLWREVADDLGIMFEFVTTEPDALVERVADGTLDLGLTGTATAADEALVDFAYPYYTTSLSVATPRTQSLWNTVKGLFTARFFRIVLFLSVLLLIVGALVWLLERGANEESFGGERGALQGIGAGFWWAAVTYDDHRLRRQGSSHLLGPRPGIFLDAVGARPNREPYRGARLGRGDGPGKQFVGAGRFARAASRRRNGHARRRLLA